MSADVLHEATPRRLLHAGGRWVLEVESLVAITRSIFRPTKALVEGEDAILVHLNSNPLGQPLLSSTTEMLRVVGPDEERVFDAGPLGWVASDSPPGSLSFAEATELQERVQRLEVERAELAKERDRLSALVRKLQSGAHDRAGSDAQSPADLLASEFGARESGAENDGFLAPNSDELAALQGIADSAGEAPAQGEERLPPINLPDAETVADTLSKIVGEAVSCSSVEEGLALDGSMKIYVSIVKNEEAEAVAAVVADVEATARIAGRLLALDDTQVQEQIDGGEALEDSIDGMGEALNMMKSMLSSAASAALSPKNLRELDVVADAWIGSSRSRLDLELSMGGRLTLVAR